MNKKIREICGIRAAKTLCAIAWVSVALASSGAQQAMTNSSAPFAPPPAPRRPSIILIFADNIGYGDAGCYGQTKIKTPNLDKLAAEGVRCTAFYAGSPEDAASRASLLTGIEPRHAHVGFAQLLDPGAQTAAEFLKQFDYRTGFLGFWGLGDTAPVMPDKKGFDQFRGYMTQAHAREYFTDKLWGHDPNFDGEETIFQNEGGRREVYIPDLLTSAAINFCRIHKPDRFNHYQPFFLCLSYPIPHPGAVPGDAPYEKQPWPQADKDRAAMITRMDENIGKLLDALDKLEMDTNTVVFFTSVGGPETETAAKFFNSAGGLRGIAGSVYEGGIRVPMIVRWPARIKPGRVSDFAWAGWDFLPTAAEIALEKPPKKIDGVSALPALLGKKERDRREFYWQSRQNGFQQSARMSDWKLVRTNTAAPPELYFLKNDPEEKQNVAGKNRGITKQLEKILNAGRP